MDSARPTFTQCQVPHFYVHSLRDQPAFFRTEKDFKPPFLVAKLSRKEFRNMGFLGAVVQLPHGLGQNAMMEHAAWWCARLQWQYPVYVVFEDDIVALITRKGSVRLAHRDEVWFVVPEFDLGPAQGAA